MDLNGQFYYVKNNQTVGPFTLDELLEKGVSNKTYIWTKGMVNWEKVESIPIILEKINNNNTSPVFINPPNDTNIPHKGKGLKKLFWFAFLGILVVVIGVVALNLKKNEPLKVEIPVKETIENDLKKENLKGEVIYIKGYNIYDYYLEFNSKGFKTKYTTYYGFIQDKEYFYEDEKLVKIIHSDNGILNQFITYLYDTEGKILKETKVDVDDLDFKFITEYKYRDKLLIETNSNYDNCRYYYTKSLLDSTMINDDISSITYTYYYNKKGQNIKILVSSYPDEPPLILTIEYNEFNEVKKRFEHDGVVNLYTYSLDERGNWIEKYENGKLVDSRKIFYKGDDPTMVKNELLKKRESSYSKSFNSDSEGQNNQIQDEYINNSNYSDNNSSGNLQPTEQHCNYCKGTGNCSLCSKVYQVRYYDFGYNKGWKIQNETRKGYIMCSECYGSGVNYKMDAGNWVIENKCYVGTCNSGWIPCNECNSRGYGTNIGSCKHCRGTGSRN